MFRQRIFCRGAIAVLGAFAICGARAEESPASPESAAALYEVGCRAVEQNDPAKAIESFHAAVTLDPSLTDAHFQLGKLYRARSRWKSALLAFQEAARTNPQNAEIQRFIGELYLTGMGRPDAAIPPLERAAALSPGDGRTHRFLGLAYLRRHRVEDAVHALHTALKCDPDDIEAAYTLGLAHNQKEQWQDARRIFERLIERHPYFAKAYQGLGNCLLRLDRREEGQTAIETFKYLVELDEKIENVRLMAARNPSHWESWHQLGYLHMEREDWENAGIAFEKCAELAPDDPRTDEAFGYLFLHMGAYPDAAKRYESLVEAYPQVAVYQSSLGVAFLMMGEYSRAIRQFQNAIRLDPTQPGFRLNLAEAYERGGNPAKAQEIRNAVDHRMP